MVGKILKSKIVNLVIFAAFISWETSKGGEDMTYYGQAIDLIKVADDELIVEGLCSSSNDCSVKKMSFWGVSKDGVTVTIYNVKSRVTIARLVNALMNRYVSNPIYDMEVVIFDRSWDDVSKISFFRHPALHLTVKHGGEKSNCSELP